MYLIFGSLFLVTAWGALMYAHRDAVGTTAEHKRASRGRGACTCIFPFRVQ